MLYRGALPAMGTRFEIVAGGDDPILIQAAVEEALEEVSIGHHLWNAFSRQSLLARIHEAGATRAVPVDAITLELLCHCVRLHQQTGGHFDPAIGTDLVRDASCRGMRRSRSIEGRPRFGCSILDAASIWAASPRDTPAIWPQRYCGMRASNAP